MRPRGKVTRPGRRSSCDRAPHGRGNYCLPVRNLMVGVTALMAVLTIVGLFFVSGDGDWSRVATPFYGGLVGLAVVILRDANDGRVSRPRLMLVVLAVLAALAVVLAGAAALSGDTVTRVATTFGALGTLVAVGASCFALYRGKSSGKDGGPTWIGDPKG